MLHTPTPWKLRPDHKKWSHYTEFRNDIVKQDGSLLLTCYPANEDSPEHEEAKANAEFIVRACNSHDELMAFVAEVAKQETRGDMSGYDFIVITARRVLAKARGEQ